FRQALHKRTTRIHAALLDQRLMACIGNIYSQEALYKASVRPTRPSKKLTRRETEVLFQRLQETLLSAIAHRGSTSRNYRDVLGESGSAQLFHALYRKGGLPCGRCG